MRTHMREVARAFGIGEATLEDLREAAMAERVDRQLAVAVLGLIDQWETSAWTRNEFRTHVRALLPATPPPPRRPNDESIYDAGLRGQRRRG